MLKSDQQEKVLTTTLPGSISETKVWWIQNKQCQQWTTRSTSEIWWISTNNGQSQKPQNWEKNQTINHYRVTPQKPKSDRAQPHHMSIWVHIRDTRCCFSNKRMTASNPHLKTIKTWTKHRCSSLNPITHPIRNRRLRQILTARILRRQKRHVAEMANLNTVIIASIETGVDIRLASTSITNPHCKGQIILRPDTMTLRKLSTHTPQVVQKNWTTHRNEWTFNKPRFTVGYTRGHPIWTSQGYALDST